MNHAIGRQLDASNITAGMRLYVKTYTLGGALVAILEDLGLEGWRIEVVQGALQSPADKKRRWGVGATLKLPTGSVEKWYEPAEI